MDKRIIAIVYSFVGETVVSIFFGFFAGRFIDGLLNTSPLFMILLMMSGVFGSLYLLVRRVNRVEDKDETR